MNSNSMMIVLRISNLIHKIPLANLQKQQPYTFSHKQNFNISLFYPKCKHTTPNYNIQQLRNYFPIFFFFVTMPSHMRFKINVTFYINSFCANWIFKYLFMFNPPSDSMVCITPLWATSHITQYSWRDRPW